MRGDNVSSGSGRMSLSPLAAYSASKFALETTTEILAQEHHPFGVRVALIEPGIIATQIFSKLHDPLTSTCSGECRINALFAAVLDALPRPPDLVAQKMLEIIDDPPPKLRHPVPPARDWRSDISDEGWIELNGAVDDEECAAGIQRVIGLDVGPYLGRMPTV